MLFPRWESYVFSEIQDSNFFIEDLQNAAGLEDESFNPLPPGLIGLA
jgi:outer membrane lipoprotein-sorting protein